MNNRLVRRYIDAAIFLGTGQSKHVVIFVDRSPYRTQRIVAVGQHIGDGEFLKPGRPRRLDDPYEGNIVRRQLIKFDLKLFHVPGSIMRLQNPVSHRILRRILTGYLLSGTGSRLFCSFHDLASVQKINTTVVQFYHLVFLLS